MFGHFQVPADNPLTEESVELGRRLFYDPRLSANGKVSCSTCHIQRLAFTDGRVTSVGVSGKPLAFNSMSLANLMWGPQHFFWNGRAATLEEQALIPIQHPDEMAQDLGRLVAELAADASYREMFETAYGEVSAAAIARALASFERTLISSNSRYDQFLRGEITLNPQEELGRKLFMAHPDVKVSLRGANCIDCHSQFLTGGFSARYDGFSNNGLDDEEHLQPGLQAVTGNPAHRGLFKVPSLRNIALTAPYMHDGRFKTLEEVLDHYDSGIRNSSTLSPLIVEADNRGAAAAGRNQPASDGNREGGHHRLPAHADGPGLRDARNGSPIRSRASESRCIEQSTSCRSLLALAAVLGITGWWLYRAAQPVELALYFHPFVGPEPLVLNESRYPNPGGEGRFKVRDFQFFLSNIRLAGGTGAYTEPDSYHLVRFDGAEPAFVIVLHDVPRRDYQRIEFGIGVDAAANESLAQRGDLDPNGRMAWNWEVGYKFVLFEGTLVRGDASDPLVYHVGFEENYRLIATELHASHWTPPRAAGFPGRHPAPVPGFYRPSTWRRYPV